ncbi:MAG: hypothetical protein Q9192_003752 [Flavoplaca navasiana]
MDPAAEREEEDIDNHDDGGEKETQDIHKSLDFREFSTLTTPDPSWQKTFRLRASSMMTKDALRNWPQSEENDQISSNFANQRGPSVGSVQSLCGQTMEELVDTVLRDSYHDPEAITASRLLSDLTSKLRDKVFWLADANQRSSSRTLIYWLKIAFDGDLFVDLSSLTHFASDLLVKAASNAMVGSMVKSVDLSHLSQLSEQGLDMLINEKCGLETLYIMMMPQISPKCVALLWAKNMAFKKLYHTDLFKLPSMQAYRYSALTKGLESPCMTDIRNPIKGILFVRVRSQEYQGLRKADGMTVDLQPSELGYSSPQTDDHMSLLFSQSTTCF